VYFADNLAHFARVLRDAGLAVGTDRVLAAVAAVEAVGLDRREDVRAALAAVMLERHDQQTMFDAAFDTFFRDPKLLEQLMHALLPTITARGEKARPPRSRRLSEALLPPQPHPPAPPRAHDPTAAETHRFDAALTFSDRERLQRADFEQMSVEEFAWAKRVAETLPPPVDPVRRRRRSPAGRGAIDLRATLRRMARQPHTLVPMRRAPRVDTPPIVVLLDISGSMERYARLFLHYAHGLARRHVRVQTLTFGTRLTAITRCLRHRDPDVALALADAQVPDWKGGTRIAACLDRFNRDWANRLLGGNAAVLLVTDGLDRDDGGALSAAAAELHRRAHRVVWLNPLLRWNGFEPKAAGVRALLPHVDRHLPVHNLASLADLGRAVAAMPRHNASAWGPRVPDRPADPGRRDGLPRQPIQPPPHATHR
jgi:uncharacterized protein with von Willebrand factor type A (vWA) domain